jgi:hypothetical protein
MPTFGKLIAHPAKITGDDIVLDISWPFLIGNGGAKLGHGSGGIVSLRAE